jgi:aryl-alcohol dehydrogenase-like predicted oxidoreductase
LFEIERSLERLQLDFVDLYQIHGCRPDNADRGDDRGARPASSGADRFAMSACPTGPPGSRQGGRDRRGPQPGPAGVAPGYYTLAGRDLEREVVPMLIRKA